MKLFITTIIFSLLLNVFIFAQETYRVGSTTYYYNKYYSTTGKPMVKRSEANKTQFLETIGYDELPDGYEIDHIIPLSDGGTDDPSNMQLLTVEEHKRKTIKERNNRSKSIYYKSYNYNSESINKYKSYPEPYCNSDGKIIYTGPKGGKYYINKNGKKTYVKTKIDDKSQDTIYKSYTPSYNSGGKTIYTGPRGGKYYINSNGNKTYIKK